MATPAPNDGQEEPAPARGRRRSSPDASRKALAKPQDKQLDDQTSPERDPTSNKDTAPKSLADFLWKVCNNEDAQDGFDRVMRTVTRSLLLLLAVVTVPIVLLATAPGPWLWKAISSGGSTALIAIITTVSHRRRKRRGGRLTAAWPIVVPVHPVAAA
jgi:hypothetical protein